MEDAFQIMKRILLFGAAGMLGSAIYNVLKDKYDLVTTSRDIEGRALLYHAYGGKSEHHLFDVSEVYKGYQNRNNTYLEGFLNTIGPVDHVINAIGITIPHALKDPGETLFVNGAFPNILANRFGDTMIHITTDCVYSGKNGAPYDEDSPKSPTDLYGLSKSIGEPSLCLTIRTSIIGPELRGHTGLLDWFLKQTGEVQGYINHMWSGITTHQFGLLCDWVLSKTWVEPGIYHVYTSPISKFRMLCAFNRRFKKNLEIIPVAADPLDRTMTSIYPLADALKIPDFYTMLGQMPWPRH